MLALESWLLSNSSLTWADLSAASLRIRERRQRTATIEYLQ